MKPFCENLRFNMGTFEKEPKDEITYQVLYDVKRVSM